jgi:SAM-dependent methyltransferase
MPTEVARLFDAMAADYDTLEPWYEHLYAVLHRLLRAWLPPAAGAPAGRALDAGCGSGFQTALLDALGYMTHGADISAGLLATARRRLPRAALVLASVEALPYPDAAFDVVTCCGSTLSFVAAPGRALGELGRVLRPGGCLLLECEHRWSLDLGWALLSSVSGDRLGYGVSPAAAWGALAAPAARSVVVHYPGYGPVTLFTLADLRSLLREAGLVPRRVWGIHVLTNLIPSTVLHRDRLPGALAGLFRALRALDRLAGRFPLTRGLANSLVILADKPGGGR